MTNQLENLLELAKIIDMNLFYVVSFRDSSIELQGHITEPSIKALSTIDGTSVIDTKNGWIRFEGDNFTITLTTRN